RLVAISSVRFQDRRRCYAFLRLHPLQISAGRADGFRCSSPAPAHHAVGVPSPNQPGEMSLKAFVAAGSMLVFSLEAGRVYLEQKAEIKTKRMEVDHLKEELKIKDREIACLEAWMDEQARCPLKTEKARLGALKAEEAQRWYSWGKY
ncbi:unnamed protein product, partial [Urochloa humidicola]